jgi:2-phosphosulfolactate phosphatase
VKLRPLYTFFLPDLVPDSLLPGSSVVVIDILRATTTMTTGLAHGAARIVPCVGVDQAHLTKQAWTERLGTGSGSQSDSQSGVLLGGERQGKPLPGFDLGNSPETYAPDVVAGRTIVMTTTNGTRAMDRCRGAAEIAIGSFANLSRIVQHLRAAAQVVLVCSGTDRHVTCEDVLFAGALTSELLRDGADWQANDQAELARVYWDQLRGQSPRPTTAQIHGVFQKSLGGTNLTAQDRGVDLLFAAEIDRFANLPILDQDGWEIGNRLG